MPDVDLGHIVQFKGEIEKEAFSTISGGMHCKEWNMMKSFAAAAILSAIAFQSAHAERVQGTVEFDGDVQTTCEIDINKSGKMVLSTAQDLGTISGGEAGEVTVSTNGNSKVSITDPTEFKEAPKGGNDMVSFSAEFSGSGATTIPPGSHSADLNPGNTLLKVDLDAKKSDVPFPVGHYTAEVTVTCE